MDRINGECRTDMTRHGESKSIAAIPKLEFNLLSYCR